MIRLHYRTQLTGLLVVFCLTSASTLFGQQLRDIVDRHFAQDLPQVPLASDAEYLRRVSIDLTGMPPSAEDTLAFIGSNDPQKREQLVEKLVQSPQFERRLANALDVMLMERRAFKDVTQEQWEEYLVTSIRNNKPWDQLAREILTADGLDEQLRPAVHFALAREAEPNLLTRDIGRIFFGRDLQCAQCHNHPLVNDYLQSDYQGLLAFVAPGFIKSVKKSVPAKKEGEKAKEVSLRVYAEKSGSDIDFSSVFVEDSQRRTGPRLVGEKAMLEPAIFPASSPESDRPVFSRRQQLAIKATDGTNRAFNENIANRLWELMFGRGLVHPPDFHHRDNPPNKPELMHELGVKMVEMKFDVREFLKELALTKVYQRSFDFPEAFGDLSAFEMQLGKLENKKGLIEDRVESLRKEYEQAGQSWENKEVELIAVSKEVDKQSKALVAAKTELDKVHVEKNKLKATVDTQMLLRDDLRAVVESVRKASFYMESAQEVSSLRQNAEARFKKAQQSVLDNLKKLTDLEQKSLVAFNKYAESQIALQKQITKRKPIQLELDQAEENARRLRSELEQLVEKENAISSSIATYEKLKEYAKLQQEVAEGSTGNLDSADVISKQEKLIQSLSIRFGKNHVVAPLKPLSPEQLCWSILKTTGYYDRQWNAEVGKFRKEKSLDAKHNLSAEQLQEIESRTHKILRGHLKRFVQYYAAGSGQPQGDFFATADQALFAANSSTLNSYINPASGNVTDRMIKATEPDEVANALFLSILTRMPDPNEVSGIAETWSKKPETKRQVAMELVWSLLNSAEFRFNH